MKDVVTMSDGQAKDVGQNTADSLTQNDTDETVAAFLELDQSGAVDLDALFDALNIATKSGGTAVEFASDDAGNGGTLTISGANISLGSVAPEDLPDATDMLVKSNIVSDES